MPRWRWEEGWVSNVPAMVTVLGSGGFDLGLQKGTWTHLLALKTASALWDQFTHLSRSSCREAVCAAGTTVGGETQTMLESSANRVRSLDWGMLGRELIERLHTGCINSRACLQPGRFKCAEGWMIAVLSMLDPLLVCSVPIPKEWLDLWTCLLEPARLLASPESENRGCRSIKC